MIPRRIRLGDDRAEPRMRIRIERPVPGWVLRAVLAVVLLGCALTVAGNPAQVALGGAAAGLLAWRPHALLLGCVIAVLAGMLLIADPGGLTWQLLVLVLGTHVAWRLGVLASVVPWSGLVEAGVLADAGRPFLGIQALAQVLALGATSLTPAAPIPWLAVGAALALAGLAWMMLVPMLAATKDSRTPRS